MAFISGADREQAVLFPEVIDDYIGPDNPVRLLDAFVAGLDLQALGFTHAQTATTGRPPYDPGDLLRLYLYGHLNRLRSSRRLEAEAARNLELIWLFHPAGVRGDPGKDGGAGGGSPRNHAGTQRHHRALLWHAQARLGL